MRDIAVLRDREAAAKELVASLKYEIEELDAHGYADRVDVRRAELDAAEGDLDWWSMWVSAAEALEHAEPVDPPTHEIQHTLKDVGIPGFAVERTERVRCRCGMSLLRSSTYVDGRQAESGLWWKRTGSYSVFPGECPLLDYNPRSCLCGYCHNQKPSCEPPPARTPPRSWSKKRSL